MYIQGETLINLFYLILSYLRTRGFIFLSLSLVNNKTKLTLSKALVQSSVHMYELLEFLI